MSIAPDWAIFYNAPFRLKKVNDCPQRNTHLNGVNVSWHLALISEGREHYIIVIKFLYTQKMFSLIPYSA